MPTGKRISQKLSEQAIFGAIKKTGIFTCSITDYTSNHLEPYLNCVKNWKRVEYRQSFDNLLTRANYETTYEGNDSLLNSEILIDRTKMRAIRNEYQNRDYDVRVKENGELPQNTGRIYIQFAGVIINYPEIKDDCSDGVPDHLRNHIIISHEIGHILLHTSNRPDVKLKPGSLPINPSMDEYDEITASRCGEWILSAYAIRCVEANVDTNYLNVESEELYKAIITVMKGVDGFNYNPSKCVTEEDGSPIDNKPVDRNKIQ